NRWAIFACPYGTTTYGLFVGLLPEPFPQFEASPVQAAADGANGHLQDLRDGFVLVPFHVLEHQDGPVVGGQMVEGLLDAPLLLGLFQGMARLAARRRVQRLGRAAVPAAQAEAHGDALLAPVADGRVDGNAIQPGEEQ